MKSKSNFVPKTIKYTPSPYGDEYCECDNIIICPHCGKPKRKRPLYEYKYRPGVMY